MLDFMIPCNSWPKDMINPATLEELGAKISACIATTPAADLKKNLRALLGSFFEKLDLVGREEFEIQMRLLQRANERLEERLNVLEKRWPATETLPNA